MTEMNTEKDTVCKEPDETIELKAIDQKYDHFDQVKDLYLYAFPDEERKPMEMILQNQKDGKMDLYALEYDGTFAGLAFVINTTPLIILDYLAVVSDFRSHGLGSKILDRLKTLYPGFVVEIESTRTASPTNQALRRKQFYLREDLQDSHVDIALFGVPMELLSWPHPVSFDDYRASMDRYFGESCARWIRTIDPEQV